MKELIFKNKKAVFWFVAVVMFYLAYVCSFKKAAQAYLLHRELSSGVTDENLSTGLVSQSVKKDSFYLAILKSYKISSSDQDYRIWTVVSAMADHAGVKIGFIPEKRASMNLDSAGIDSTLIVKHFELKGSYDGLVTMLDTLSRSTGVGRIADVKIFSPKDVSRHQDNRLAMEITLKGRR